MIVLIGVLALLCLLTGDRDKAPLVALSLISLPYIVIAGYLLVVANTTPH